MESYSHDPLAVESPVVLVLMGVSGCGKSTVAALLSGQLDWPFEEGDALHPQANIDKMAAGDALTDDDRWPWLDSVADWIDAQLDAGRNGVITCSALKRSYRDVLNRRGSGVRFIYLAGSREIIGERIAARHGHFMPTSLLDSQFATLEEPADDEPSLRIDIGPEPQAIVDQIVETFGWEADRTAAPRAAEPIHDEPAETDPTAAGPTEAEPTT